MVPIGDFSRYVDYNLSEEKGRTFGRNHSNLSCVQVREVKEELRSMRLEAHTKQLAKELKSARAALEQERKLRKVQSDTIKVKVSR